jgi:hypothetical protein
MDFYILTEDEKNEINNYLSLSTNDLILLVSIFNGETSFTEVENTLSASTLELIKEKICPILQADQEIILTELNSAHLIMAIKDMILESGLVVNMPILLLSTTIIKIGISLFCQCT